jgi:ribosome production factor 2
VQDALTDLHSMRQPLAKKFSKKNAVRPFEDAASLEFFSEKNDTSLLAFGSSQKKRPHALTLVRTFAHRVYDMLELHLDPATFRTMAQFRTKKFAVGLKPMVLFAGTVFESPVENEYTLAKSLLLDFFRGEPHEKVDVEGLQYIVSITAEEPVGEGDGDAAKPVIHLRTYLIRSRRSGHRLPRVEVDEMGPRMDFRVGRSKVPDEATRKEAMRKPRGTDERTKKNISTSAMGDKVGRIHKGRQDLGMLQTRKVKALKRSRDEDNDGEAADAEESSKKKRV